MDAFLGWLEETVVATTIRDSLLLFPLLESIHVFGLALVVGTAVVIDLRLLGVASTSRSFERMASEIMKWTWAAFALTAVAGLLMFSTKAQIYFHNVYFRAKILLLALAALNALVFQRTVWRTVARWDTARSAPALGKVVATVSLAIWVGVVFAGRMIGFTTTRVTTPEPSEEINFEELLGLPGNTDSQPAVPEKK